MKSGRVGTVTPATAVPAPGSEHGRVPIRSLRSVHELSESMALEGRCDGRGAAYTHSVPQGHLGGRRGTARIAAGHVDEPFHA